MYFTYLSLKQFIATKFVNWLKGELLVLRGSDTTLLPSKMASFLRQIIFHARI